MLMRSPSGNRVTARQEDGLIFAPTEDIYLQATELCLCQDFFSGQLDTAGCITVSKRPGKTEDCGTVKVPLAEAFGWGRSILHVCSVDGEMLSGWRVLHTVRAVVLCTQST